MHCVLLFLLLSITMAKSAALRNTSDDVNTSLSNRNPGSDVGLQVVNTVTRFLSILPIKDQLVTALSVPVARAYDTLRPGLKAIGFAYLAYQAIMYLLPSVANGLTDGPTARGAQPLESSKSLSEAIGELGVSAMARGLQALNVTPSSTEILNNWEQECNRRAACELGKSLAERIPYVSWIFGYFGPRFPIIGQFADAFTQGLSRPDCSLLYQDCPYLRPTPNT